MKMPLTMKRLTQPREPTIDKVALFQQKFLEYLKNDEVPSTEELKNKTGFDEVDLNGLEPELQRPVLAMFAAFEEVFHVNSRLKENLFFKVIQRINDPLKRLDRPPYEEKLALKAGNLSYGTAANANKNTGIRFNPNSVDATDYYSEINGFSVNAGEGMPLEIRGLLYTFLIFMHECGHQEESCLADQCFDELFRKIGKKILGCVGLSENILSMASKLDLRHVPGDFKMFVCHKFMQYAIEQTEKEYGEKPVFGLIFKPGGKAKSLSLYAATNAKDFYAELFAKVLFTHPDYLTPLGKTLRKLLNSDHAAFRKWFRDGFTLEAYEAYKKYYAKHNGYEKCPTFNDILEDRLRTEKVIAEEKWLNRALKPFGFEGEIRTIRFSPVLRFAIQFKLISNYNIAGSDEKATELQTKLANAVTILTKLRKLDDEDSVAQKISAKCFDWWVKKSKLLLLSEYCGCADPDCQDEVLENTSDAYALLDILETLMEKEPKDFETPEACESFLDTELEAVEQEIKEAEARRASKCNKKKINIMAEKESGASAVPQFGTQGTEPKNLRFKV